MYQDLLKQECQKILVEFNNSNTIKKVLEARITIMHYSSLMLQIAHHARENPQLQALATVYFRGEQRDIIKMFYKHAISEIGHDKLALNDAAACGINITDVQYENPLPSTIALTSFGFYQVQNLDPIGYLGYLYFLEFMPTQCGQMYINAFRQIGIPDNAMSFVKDHATIDLGHNKLMEKYIEHLIINDQQFHSVIYSMKVTAHLYLKMIEGAFNQIDKPVSYGWSMPEVRYRTTTDNISQKQSLLEMA